MKRRLIGGISLWEIGCSFFGARRGFEEEIRRFVGGEVLGDGDMCGFLGFGNLTFFAVLGVYFGLFWGIFWEDGGMVKKD